METLKEPGFSLKLHYKLKVFKPGDSNRIEYNHKGIRLYIGLTLTELTIIRLKGTVQADKISLQVVLLHIVLDYGIPLHMF